MVDIYRFELDADSFERVVQGKKTIQLVINDSKHKVYSIGNQLVFALKTEEGVEPKEVKATIDQLLYFADVKEAVETLGKEKCGFKPSATFEKASDLFLSNENFENIEKYGIMAVLFTVING